MDTPDERQGISIPLAFSGMEETPILYVNHFITQRQREGAVVLIASQLTPPLLLGTEDDQRRQAEQVDYVPVRTVARLAVTPSSLRELVRVLQAALDHYPDAEATSEGGE